MKKLMQFVQREWLICTLIIGAAVFVGGIIAYSAHDSGDDSSVDEQGECQGPPDADGNPPECGVTYGVTYWVKDFGTGIWDFQCGEPATVGDSMVRAEGGQCFACSEPRTP